MKSRGDGDCWTFSYLLWFWLRCKESDWWARRDPLCENFGFQFTSFFNTFTDCAPSAYVLSSANHSHVRNL